MADWRIIHQLEGPPDLAQMEAKQAVYEGARAKRDELRQQKMSESAIRRAVQEAQGDPTRAVQRLYEIGEVDAAGKLESHLGKLQKEKADRRKVELDNDAAMGKQFDEVAAMMTPENYGQARAFILSNDPKFAPFLPAQYDPSVQARFRQRLIPALDLIKEERLKLEHADQVANQNRSAEHSAATLAETTRQNNLTDADRDATRVLTAEQQAATRQNQAGMLDIARGNLAVNQGNLKARQSEAAAGGAGGAKLSAGAIEKVARMDQSLGMIDDIGNVVDKMSGYIGAYDGRLAQAKIASGANVPKDLADFDTQITALKNAVISATTGAAMSEPEAQRIMGQIPDMTNSETVFKSRLAMTKKNLELLKRRTLELSGGSVAAPATPTTRTSKYTVEVVE